MAWHFRSVSALLLPAADGPSVIHRDFPHAKLFPDPGHDGQQFYVIARNPFHPRTTAQQLDNPARRYRRVLFPVLGRLLSPVNGAPLVIALAVVSIIGVVIGAIALCEYPGAPAWIALAVPLNIGVMVAQFLTLSDALATGLILAVYAAAFRKRWVLAVVFSVLACLTREAAILVVIPLAFWPGISWRRRIAVTAPAVGILAAWTFLVVRLVGVHHLDSTGGDIGLPFRGWSGVTGFDLVAPLCGALLIVAGACRRGTPRPIRIFLILNLALLACFGPNVAFSWVDSVRGIAPAISIAVWALARRPERSGPTVSPAGGV